MGNEIGGIIFIVLVIAAIIAILYIIFISLAGAAIIAAAVGTLCGGGTAIINYGKSFKEHMIDSN